SWVVVCHGVARNYMRIAFLAELWGSLPPRAYYAPCGAAGLVLLAIVCRLCSLRSDFRLVALGPFDCAGIVKTVHLSLSNPFDGRCGHVSSSYPSRVRFCSLSSNFISRKMVTHTIDNVTSVLTQRELDLFCGMYNIPAELRPELPGRDDTIKNILAGKIGIYTRFLEFANFRIPLSRFLLHVLEYYQINFSQLSVLGAAKVSHFEIMCRVLGYRPSLGTFCKFYVKSISNGWLSFLRLGPTPCCLLKKFDSLRSWNYHFFWVDASICPISVPWHVGAFVLKDPLPPDNHVNAELLALLDHHRTIIRRYPETFLYLVGLSCSFDDVDVRPTLLKDDGSDGLRNMGLLDFVKSSDPFKVKTRERTLAEGEIPLNDETLNMTVPPSAEIIQIVHHTIPDELKEHAATSGKRLLRLKWILRLEWLLRLLWPAASVEFVSFYGLLLPLSMMFLRNCCSSRDDNVVSPRAEPHAGVRGIVAASAGGIGASGNNVEASTSVLGANSPTDDFFILKLMEKAEHEAAEVVVLRGYVSELEAKMAVKSEEVNTLSKQNTKLLSKVSTFESEHRELNRHIIKLGADCECLRNKVVSEAKLREEFKSFLDAMEQRFSERAKELDAHIADVRHDMDNDLYPYMLTAVVISMAINKGIQQGLEAGVVHGKAGRSLPQIEAYDPEIEAKYVADDLGDTNVTPEFFRFQHSIDQVTVLIYADFSSIDREMLLSDAIPAIRGSSTRRGLYPPLTSKPGRASNSAPPHDSSLGVTDHQVSTLALSSDEGYATQPPVVQAHDDLFDTSVLDRSGGV
ncbi:hypothetical protein Tco_0697665, partial [Tanacetum coccineum]